MGRAYTDEEREEIRVRLLETAVELYHDENTKALNIRDLTKQAGISLGCFYSFYKDKDDLILAVIRYRGLQKMENIVIDYDAALASPSGYLSSMIYGFIVDLRTKAVNKKMYEDALEIAGRKSAEYSDIFGQMLEKTVSRLVDFWEAGGYRVSADIKGISAVMAGASCLLSGGIRIPHPYFDDMLRSFIDVNMRKYLHVESKA